MKIEIQEEKKQKITRDRANLIKKFKKLIVVTQMLFYWN